MAKVTTPQPSIAVGTSLRIGVSRGRDRVEAAVLDRVRRKPVAAARPALRAAEREHPRVLAGAVVLQRGWFGATLELVLPGRRLCQQAPHRGKLLGGGEVRRGSDRDLLGRQVVARANQRQRLERLRSRAEIRDAAGIARLLDHLAVAHRDRVHDVDRLDDVAPPDDHLDRVHRGSLCLDKWAALPYGRE